MGVNKTIFVSSEYQILKVDKQENDHFFKYTHSFPSRKAQNSHHD